jgi:hypothetical protein
MPTFSERIGKKPMKKIILRDSINDEIRNGLWSVIELSFWKSLKSPEDLYPLWMHYYKEPIDTIPKDGSDVYAIIRKRFFGSGWNQVYDFIEFIACNFGYRQKMEGVDIGFMKACNFILERELSAYRFIDGIIAPLTSEEEIAEVDEALEKSQPIGSVSDHLRRSIELLADRKNPDYRNSIKESISSVEAICKLIVCSDKSTLGEALKIIDNDINMHPAFKKALSNIYGYTSDAEGIRHSLLDEPTLDLEDAKFMLVSCSAFTNYLIAKSSKQV